MLLLRNGDIMGISGILSNTLVNPVQSLRDSQHHWRWVYLASFALAVNICVNYLSPNEAFEDHRSDVPIPSKTAHVLGGLLVGLGTRLGNGCTTGHGICGIGRFSKRSLVATTIFTGCSMLTRYVLSPLRSWQARFAFLRSAQIPVVSPLVGAVVMAGSCLAAMVRFTEVDEIDSRKTLGAAISGAMFATGLALSGMTKNSKVHDFLCLSGFANMTYDPSKWLDCLALSVMYRLL